MCMQTTQGCCHHPIGSVPADTALLAVPRSLWPSAGAACRRSAGGCHRTVQVSLAANPLAHELLLRAGTPWWLPMHLRHCAESRQAIALLLLSALPPTTFAAPARSRALVALTRTCGIVPGIHSGGDCHLPFRDFSSVPEQAATSSPLYCLQMLPWWLSPESQASCWASSSP